MGKSTISMATFNSYVCLLEANSLHEEGFQHMCEMQKSAHTQSAAKTFLFVCTHELEAIAIAMKF